ncbi:uncharacterized protein LOC6528801 [Drosophila yakuba]|uniref:Uncharacterized protein n=1 Tax=Drosophila yakuba TaxID=7245 RepID=B4NWK0_DROYA|nr:uncharacterized protein LOC6528801 [Drosophila yakuba]EDW89545.1 uncharacterized protein Dyak_GE19299 [Drosophila yakuba]
MSLELHKVLLVLSIANSALVRAALEVRIESVTKIFGDNETLFEFNFRLVGRQRLLNGTVIIHVDLDNEYDVSNDVLSLRNGEWESTNVAVNFKTCKYMALIYDRYFAVSFKDSNIPKSTEACPIKKGEYYARNVEVIADNWVQYTKLGLVRSILVVKKDNVVYGGIDVVLVLSQKIM